MRDWKDVRLGVGASSAMSFRFDMQGLRVVDRGRSTTNSSSRSPRTNVAGKGRDGPGPSASPGATAA